MNADWTVHPGTSIIDGLRERAEDSGRSVRSLVDRLLSQCSPEAICASLRVTPPIADALSQTFGNPAGFWLKLQENHDEACMRLKIDAATAERFALRDVGVE